MKETNKLCVKAERYGTLDLWINDDKHWTFGNEDVKWEIIATYNGESPEQGEAYRYTLDKNPVEALDSFMGILGRDIENWFYKDIVIHWGVHTWKFINEKNIDIVERDEYVQTLDDIQYFHNVEW